jgi:hypothetical protein
MTSGNPVVLVNRTSEVLSFVVDGQHFKINPGENFGFHSGQVRFAKTQNIVRGTENYSTTRFESLVGVKGTTDDVSPISNEDLQAAIELSNGERFDRSSMGPGAQRTTKINSRHQSIGRIAALSGSESMAIGE